MFEISSWPSAKRGSRPSEMKEINMVLMILLFLDLTMRLSKTEVNLRRLLASAPRQQNQAKLIHYITTLRELLEHLESETTSDGISSISKAKMNEYSEKIEALAAKLASQQEPAETVTEASAIEENPPQEDEDKSYTNPSAGLRRRAGARSETDNTSEPSQRESAMPVKLDAAGQALIEKHRKIQEDLTDQMVGFAQQLKERSYMMHQSLEDTVKILDSTEKAVEDSLGGVGRANTRAMQVNSGSFKTTCLVWLMMFAMTCMFIMVVLLIRVT